MDILADCWPQMEADISNLLRVVVPVRSPQFDVHMSCSSDVFRFAVLISEGAPEMLAEALIHELGHNLLNVSIEEGEVFEGSPPHEAILYSPWRKDARPLSGVLHAAFVFERVCEFYRRYLERRQDRRIQERYKLMAARICLAVEALAGSDKKLTQYGANLTKEIRERGFEHAEAAGFIHDEATRSQLREHYDTWKVQNPTGRRPEGKYMSMLLRS
jgi:HEXXH motif-containing protein